MTDRDPESAELIERIQKLSQPLQPQPTGHPDKMRGLGEIRAVIFDIYGTLLISGSGDIGAGTAGEGNAESAWRAALAAAGCPLDSTDAVPGGPQQLEKAVRQAHAARREEGIEYPEVDILAIWEQVAPQFCGGSPRTRLSPHQLRILALEYECRTNPVWPMPGLRETLDGLVGKDLLLGIVSNAQFYTPLLFQALLGASPPELGFKADLCAWSYRSLEAKPSTRLFRGVFDRLAGEYGIPAQATLYVGNDRLKDIWPATQMGARTALFAGDRRSLRLREDDERCRAAEPDLVISDLRQLLSVLK